MFAVDFFEFDVLHFYFVILIPILLETPDVLEIVNLLIDVVEIGGRSIGDRE